MLNFRGGSQLDGLRRWWGGGNRMTVHCIPKVVAPTGPLNVAKGERT